MRDLLKLALLAGGGYYLYQRYGASWFGTGTRLCEDGRGNVGPCPEATQTEPPAASEPVVQNPAYSPTTRDRVANAARLAGNPDLLSFDQWNYYFEQVRGIPGPPIEAVFPNLNRATRMSVDDWWNAIAARGLEELV